MMEGIVVFLEIKLGLIRNALESKVLIGVLCNPVEHRMCELILHAHHEIGAIKH